MASSASTKGAYLVSACLLGVSCRYDARQLKEVPECPLLRDAGCIIPVCPEQLGGLPTPRAAAEIVGGDGAGVLDGRCRVVNVEGVDVTEEFLRGAQEALLLARTFQAHTAVLKTRSPSCGFGWIYHGEDLVAGNGVTAELLRRNGIRIVPWPE